MEIFLTILIFWTIIGGFFFLNDNFSWGICTWNSNIAFFIIIGPIPWLIILSILLITYIQLWFRKIKKKIKK